MKTSYRILLHILFWFFLLGCFSAFFYVDGKRVNINVFYRLGLGITFFYINYSLLVPLFLFKKKKVSYFISVVLLLVVAHAIFGLLHPAKLHFLNLEHLPFKGERFRSMGFRDGRPKFITVLFVLVSVVMGTIIQVYQKWIQDENRRQEIESQKNKTELESLKNQLNPHFLFNSLNSIYSLSVKKSDDTPEAIIMLSELMRYMLYKANKNTVLLNEELAYIENYLQLQRLRIANNENVRINIRGNISAQKISPLLFISYIENAFKYGTDYSGNTFVSIDISVKDNELQFTCTNLIGSRTTDENNSGIGLENTKSRLLLLYPNKHSLTISEENNKFTVNLALTLD